MILCPVICDDYQTGEKEQEWLWPVSVCVLYNIIGNHSGQRISSMLWASH